MIFLIHYKPVSFFLSLINQCVTLLMEMGWNIYLILLGEKYGFLVCSNVIFHLCNILRAATGGLPAIPPVEACSWSQCAHLSTEKGSIRVKTDTLKKCIHAILSGEKIPGILMTVIRFVLPLQDHTIKKLLLIFWEIVPKTLPDGKLMQEMILVCDAYRKVCTMPMMPP